MRRAFFCLVIAALLLTGSARAIKPSFLYHQNGLACSRWSYTRGWIDICGTVPKYQAWPPTYTATVVHTSQTFVCNIWVYSGERTGQVKRCVLVYSSPGVKA